LNNEPERRTFPLASLFPQWRGERVETMKQPLRRGLALLQAQLGQAPALALVTRREFDYDGMLDRIEEIAPLSVEADASAAADALLARYLAIELTRNPGLKPDPKPVLPLEVLPATRTRMAGCYPPQQVGVRLANDPLYEAVYLRVHVS